jgi:hypothetical protein
MNYSEKLSTHSWKQKRKEILLRDDFTCQVCGHKDIKNEIHHSIYYPDTDPWHYPNDNLITLCRVCHQQEEDLKDFDLSSLRFLFSIGMLRTELKDIISKLSQANDDFDNRELIKEFIVHINKFKMFK